MTEDRHKLARLEAALLDQIATLHPDRLTTDELVLLMEGPRCNRLTVLDALAGLRRCGLARQRGDLVEPTYTALCAYELLTL